MIHFFKSYLSNRRQSVLYKEYKTNCFYVGSGVPQGSNLGPLLFLLFINDLPHYIQNSRKLLFADDLKIFVNVKSLDDCLLLQQDLTSILKWCSRNRLEINIGKCKAMTYSRREKTYDFTYSINGISLKKLDTIKDLGVTFDSKLTFSPHVVNITNDAYRNLGFLVRTTKEFANDSTLKTLYYSYVRSKLEYASLIWNTSMKASCQKIEHVQSKFFSFLTYKLVSTRNTNLTTI